MQNLLDLIPPSDVSTLLKSSKRLEDHLILKSIEDLYDRVAKGQVQDLKADLDEQFNKWVRAYSMSLNITML
jgi:hypothetical protein